MKKKAIALVMTLVLCLCTIGAIPISAKSKKTTIELNKTNITLNVGKSTKLKLNNVSKKYVDWASGDKTIATVENGKVTGLKAGTTSIYAFYQSEIFSCTITVKDKEKKSEANADIDPLQNVSIGYVVFEFPIGWYLNSSDKEMQYGYMNVSYFDEFTNKYYSVNILNQGFDTDKKLKEAQKAFKKGWSADYMSDFYKGLELQGFEITSSLVQFDKNEDEKFYGVIVKDTLGNQYKIYVVLYDCILSTIVVSADDGSLPTDKIDDYVEATIKNATYHK